MAFPAPGIRPNALTGVDSRQFFGLPPLTESTVVRSLLPSLHATPVSLCSSTPYADPIFKLLGREAQGVSPQGLRRAEGLSLWHIIVTAALNVKTRLFLGHIEEKLRAYDDRIADLRYLGWQEGISLSTASVKTFVRFLRDNPTMKRADLVLMDSGNLRATWEIEDQTRVGLQFLPTGRVQFVIFARRVSEDYVSRVHGRDTIAGVGTQLRAFDLDRVLYS